MGGTGALELALKHPDVFGAVYAMSPAILSGDDVRTFTADGDGQADAWRALTVQWSRLDEKAALKAFRLYMQDRLNTFAQRVQFEGLRVSYAAAALGITRTKLYTRLRRFGLPL